ncbi:MAG: hypothetical protein HY835_05355 [Anaerolineae bacterium]|nr:hypothetical protein [Anaerolineae bacterium]
MTNVQNIFQTGIFIWPFQRSMVERLKLKADILRHCVMGGLGTPRGWRDRQNSALKVRLQGKMDAL